MLGSGAYRQLRGFVRKAVFTLASLAGLAAWGQATFGRTLLQGETSDDVAFRITYVADSGVADAGIPAPAFFFADSATYSDFPAYAGLPATDGCKNPATITGGRGEALTFARATTRFCPVDANESTGTMCASGEACLQSRGLSVYQDGANVALRSEAFDNAAWVKVTTTVTPDSTAAPDGATTADTLTDASGVASGSACQTITTSSLTKHDFSVWLRAGTLAEATLTVTGTGNSAGDVSCAFTGISSSAWRRYECVSPAAYAAGLTAVVACVVSGDAAGDTGTIIAWGAMHEVASTTYKTPYVATAGSTTTRNAETASFTVTLPFSTFSATATNSRTPAVGQDQVWLTAGAAPDSYALYNSGATTAVGWGKTSGGNTITSTTVTPVADAVMTTSWGAGGTNQPCYNGQCATPAAITGSPASTVGVIYIGFNGAGHGGLAGGYADGTISNVGWDGDADRFCTVGPNLLQNADDMTGGNWGTVRLTAVTPDYADDPGGTSASNRVQFQAVSGAEESTIYQSLSHQCDGLTCTFSVYLRATSGGTGPSSGNVPLAIASNGTDGFNFQLCPYTTAWSRCVIEFDNTGTFSSFMLGYANFGAGTSGTGPAQDIEFWAPKAELGTGGASPYVCPSPLQGVYGREGYEASLVTNNWGLLSRDGAGLVALADGTLILTGGWHSGGRAEWSQDGGSNVTTNEIWASIADAGSWISVLAHSDDPPQTGASARWRRRHSHIPLTATFGGTEYIYVIGGDGLDTFYGTTTGPYPTDVWRAPASTFGASGWVAMTKDAGYGSRALHMAWKMPSADGGTNLYVGGGQANVFDKTTSLHDTFVSYDEGVTWLPIADAGWMGRGSIANALPLLNGRIYLPGGQQYDTGTHNYFRDVWAFDGGEWVLITADAGFTARGYHNALAFDGKVCVMRGVISPSPAVINDLVCSEDGASWTENPGIFGRVEHAGSAVVRNDGAKLLICGGDDQGNPYVWTVTNP